jgi:hypothetical protein
MSAIMLALLWPSPWWIMRGSPLEFATVVNLQAYPIYCNTFIARNLHVSKA